MKRWILSIRVEFPRDERVMMRHGNSVCDGYYSTIHDQWFMLVPCGSSEKVDPPEWLWLDEEYAREHPRFISAGSRVGKSSRRERKPVQMGLDL